MIFLSIVFFIFVVYPAIGLAATRKRYTKAVRHYGTHRNTIAEQNLADVKKELAGLHHGICNLGYPELSRRGCDCGQKQKWGQLRATIAELRKSVVDKPNPQYTTIALWPGSLVESYVKGGASALPDYDLIEQMERSELEIG